MNQFRTYKLAVELYRECKKLKSEELRNQLIRASSSISLNLSEGASKPSEKDRRRYYSIALGSLREVQTILELLEIESLNELTDHLGACLYKLARK